MTAARRLDLFLSTDEDGVGDGEISPTILSGSSVKTYMRCQKQWEIPSTHTSSS